MIQFIKPPSTPARAAELKSDRARDSVDVSAWSSSIDLMTVPAAWPVAVSELAQKFMACQIREQRDRRD
jgi:hypothetical protein